MEKLKEILKSYYFVEWKDEDECIKTIGESINKWHVEEVKRIMPDTKNLENKIPNKVYESYWIVGWNCYRSELLKRLGVEDEG